MNVKREFIQYLLELIDSHRIKSFRSNDNIIDNSINIESIINTEIRVSNSIVPILCEKFDISFVGKFLNEKYDITVINDKGKFIGIQVTNHSILQLIKRVILIYLEESRFEFNNEIHSVIANNFNNYIDIMISTNWKEEDLLKPQVKELIEVLLKHSKYFDVSTATRKRDLLAFSKRDSTHNKCSRYFSHPFLFIVEDNVLKTVELYSDSFDCRHLNKLTSNNKTFIDYLMDNHISNSK